MPVIEGLVQNSPEWLLHRIGMVTASKVAAIVGRKKPTKGQQVGEYLKARQDYLWDVVIERLTGRSAETYVSPAMEWGIETEPLARAAYEMDRDEEVELVGFVQHPAIEWFGASPDGFVGKDGLLEIKCPNTSTHLEYLLEGNPPLEYLPQMLAQMSCAERQWVDFVSYDPRLPKNLRYFHRRFYREEAQMTALENEVTTFLDEVILKLGDLAKRAESEGLEAIPAPDRSQRAANAPE